ncbi:hypothetical protein WJX84_004485 [Apatococcus fuscideae]|uniref:Secreted protein n=1 Tax=Apatococcus fuscideae TaxID=2026836 RepID=A0AAW1T119_9CHLO
MGSLQMVPMTSIIQFLLVPRQISGVFCPVWLDNNTACSVRFLWRVQEPQIRMGASVPACIICFQWGAPVLMQRICPPPVET